mmetsp:Transcript_11356/g.27946  ORF Transcript_11356/g.27946 Transcript_11356/m.27946 type:complete len:232 (+) Transcript_11356:714-1409(+)
MRTSASWNWAGAAWSRSRSMTRTTPSSPSRWLRSGRMERGSLADITRLWMDRFGRTKPASRSTRTCLKRLSFLCIIMDFGGKISTIPSRWRSGRTTGKWSSTSRYQGGSLTNSPTGPPARIRLATTRHLIWRTCGSSNYHICGGRSRMSSAEPATRRNAGEIERPLRRGSGWTRSTARIRKRQNWRSCSTFIRPFAIRRSWATDMCTGACGLYHRLTKLRRRRVISSAMVN